MKTIKQYNKDELITLIKAHNNIVKVCYAIAQFDTETMLNLIAGADVDNPLTLPHFEIPSNETLSGNAYIFKLQWNDIYRVKGSSEADTFFIDEDDQECAGSKLRVDDVNLGCEILKTKGSTGKELARHRG